MEIKDAERLLSNSIVRNYNNTDTSNSEENQEEKQTSEISILLDAVPTFRRTLSIPNMLDNGELLTAAGMAGLALINFHEDIKDVKGALKQIQGEAPKYDHNNYQHKFSFFRGTFLESWLNKKSKEGKTWASWLYNNDITIAETPLGESILKKLNAEKIDETETSIKDLNKNSVQAVKYKAPLLAELTGRAMLRTSVLGVGAAALLEAPKIIHKAEKGEGEKQTVKSLINIASSTAGIGYGGAIGFKYKGSLGSLLGMGVGAFLGNKVSNTAQSFV